MKRFYKTAPDGLHYLPVKKVWSLAGFLALLTGIVIPAQAAMVTVTGRLTRDADDKTFFMKDSRGNPYKVDTTLFPRAESANKLLEGNTVRVHGSMMNGILYATNLRFLGSSYVKKGTRIATTNYRAGAGRKATLVGTLLNDADDDAFEIRDNRGRMHKIFTRMIPDWRGANKLQKGHFVRVHGRWAADDNGWAYLEASNIRILR
jgi:uncharacterized protein YdeI (BOF family)